MNQIITFSEQRSNIYSQKVDAYQNIIEAFIKNDYFIWVILVLLFNHRNWKRPVILILIGHWVLRSIGDALNNSFPFMPWEANTYWPYTNKAWLICCVIANIFWLLGEIIGDWYPYLRTKAVTENSRKIRSVFAMCIIYNLVKVGLIVCYIRNRSIDFRLQDENGKLVKDIARFKIKWWSIEIVLQIVSCLYDLSVIYALRSCLFNKLNEYKTVSKNTFLSKFKQISEYRIIISMIASLIFLPFIFLFVLYVVSKYKDNGTYSYVPSDETIDYLRRTVLNFNYTLMYIDQILLKAISEKPRKMYKYGISSNSNNTNSSNYYSNHFSSNNNSSNNFSNNGNFNSLSYNSTLKNSSSHELDEDLYSSFGNDLVSPTYSDTQMLPLNNNNNKNKYPMKYNKYNNTLMDNSISPISPISPFEKNRYGNSLSYSHDEKYFNSYPFNNNGNSSIPRNIISSKYHVNDNSSFEINGPYRISDMKITVENIPYNNENKVKFLRKKTQY